MRAQRLGLPTDKLRLMAETHLQTIVASAQNLALPSTGGGFHTSGAQ